MFAIARSSITKRQFHTVPVILAEEGGIFGKLNPWAKKPVATTTTTTAQPTEQVTPAHQSTESPVTFNVKYQDADEVISWKRSEPLVEVEEIENVVKSVILQTVKEATEENWKDLPIKDLETKFKLLKESIKETGKEVPNYELDGFTSTNDVLTYFKHGETSLQAQQKVTIQSYFEEHDDVLPKNLTFAPRE